MKFNDVGRIVIKGEKDKYSRIRRMKIKGEVDDLYKKRTLLLKGSYKKKKEKSVLEKTILERLLEIEGWHRGKAKTHSKKCYNGSSCSLTEHHLLLSTKFKDVINELRKCKTCSSISVVNKRFK